MCFLGFFDSLGLDKPRSTCYNTRITNTQQKEKQMSDYKFENTIGGKLVKELNREIRECIVVSNHWLPAEFHDDVRGGRTLARLEQMCEEHNRGPSKFRDLKDIKAENVENYRKQFEENELFEYNGHINELQLHRNEMAFCTACPDIDMEN